MTVSGDSTLEAAAARSTVGLLRDRGFGPYLAGNFLSSTGNWFQNVAAAAVVFQLTGSSVLVGIVSAMQFGTTLLLAPISGAVADRVDRRKLMVGAQTLSFLGAAALAIAVLVVGVAGLPGPWPIYLATAIIGIGFAVTIPTTQAIVPALVPRPDLPQAIAMGSVSFNLARAVGPGLAGLTLAALGAGISFSVNALSFAGFAVILVLLRPYRSTRPTLASGAGRDRSFRVGVRIAREDPFIVRALLVTGALGFTTDPVNTLAPALADHHGQGNAFIGLIGSFFGIGAVTVSLLLRRLRQRFPRTRLAEGGYALLATGLLMVVVSPVGPVVLAGMTVAGAGFLLSVTTLNSELQLRLDDEVRGRVMALWTMGFLGFRPVAALVDGSVSDAFGVRAGVGLAATVAVGAALALRVTRHLDPPGTTT